MKNDRTKARGDERGFSIIELVVAMTVTLIITGAVFQLVTAGSNAFRKEPEVADRQQSIRVAMDLISQDVYRAGFGVPSFAQVFRSGLNARGPMGSGGALADEIEIIMASDCPPLEICKSSPSGASWVTTEKFSSCYNLPALVILGGDKSAGATPQEKQTWGMRWVEAPGNTEVGRGVCSTGEAEGTHGHAVAPHGLAELYNPPGGFGGWEPEWMIVGQAVRYRIQADATGVPNLERSTAGGQPDINGNSTWQIIARGVEDLQVEYENGIVTAGSRWHDDPGTTSCSVCIPATVAENNTIVRKVRVRLSARATAANLTGQTTSAVGSAVRGQLVNEIAPRAAAATLGTGAGEM